jgi:hypothetical protein
MNTHAAWSVDGKHLYCLHDLDGKLWRWDAVEVASGKTEPFAALTPAPYAHGGRIAWRPIK